MGNLTRDDNFVPGILLKGSSTGADVQWEGGETSKAGLVELVTPSGDSVLDDTNDAVKVTLATQLDKTNDSILIYANTAKDGTGTDLIPLLDSDGHLQVDTLSSSPGTGATNLGKAEDAAHSSGDVGVMALAVYKDEPAQLAGTDGDYTPLIADGTGRLHSNVEHDTVLDAMNATAGWAVLGNDTTNLATTLNHIHGTNALEFDKANGADNTIFAGIEKTITSVDITDHTNHGIIQVPFYVSSTAQVAYVFIRIGTNSSHYNEWRIDDDDITAGVWSPGTININSPDVGGNTGNGWNPSAVTYLAVGVAFDGQTNLLEDIRFDEIAVHSSLHTLGTLSAFVTSSVSTPNVRLNSYGNAVDINAGNVSSQTLRVVLASDQNFTHLEDVQHSTGDAGIMALAVENEDQADLSTGDKDYTPIAVTKEGNVIIKSEGTITVDANSSDVTVDNAAGSGVYVRPGTSAVFPVSNTSIDGPGAPTVDSYTHLAINLNAGADQVLVSSAANKQIWVYGITYTCSVAGTVSFQDEDNTAITGIMDHAANSGLSHPPSGNFAMPIWKLGTDKDLEVDVVDCAIDGWLDFAIVSV